MTDTDSDNKQEQEYEKTTISLSDGTTFDFVDNRTREQRLADSKKRVQKWEEENPERAAEIDLRIENEWKYRDAALYLSEPQVTGFTYTIPITPDATWGDDLEVDFKAKLQYALTAQTTLPYVDKEEREKWKEDAIPDKGWLIKEIEYA